MIFIGHVSKEDAIFRYDMDDVVRIFGRALKEKGFNLEMEFTWRHKYNFETGLHTVLVSQHDRFKVRGRFEVIPSAIL